MKLRSKEPINDIRAIGEELRRGGFDVEIGENLTREGMQRALAKFYGKLQPGSVGLVYFSESAESAPRYVLARPEFSPIYVKPA